MNKVKLFYIVIFAMILVPFSFSLQANAMGADPASQTLSYSGLDKEFQAHAANQVVDELYDQNKYEEVMNQIGAGQSDWISLSPELAAGAESRALADSNDVASVALSFALASALPVNPKAVLSVLDMNGKSRTLKPEAVCSTPWEMNWGKEYSNYVNQSIRAVEKINVPNLKNRKAACLSELKKIAKNMDSQESN